VESLGIEIENPNREKKEHIKVADLGKLNVGSGTQLSRREREAVEKQKMQNRIEKNDLVRLAEIRKQRDEAAKRREEETKSKEDGKGKKEGVKSQQK